MKRTGFAEASCPVARALDAIGDVWSLLIVRDAFDGLRRFGDFQKNLGIAKGMLSARLHRLVELGVLEAVPASDGSAYQEYALTKKGRDLFPVVVSLRQWGEGNLFARGEVHSDLVDEAGHPVGKLVLPSRAGRPLTWSDTRVRKAGARKR
ncbi:winged helix-turn-helix transcriptional regulator [Bradyrhizobium symbiodeficiens]|uniref:Helix-turn-helix domain-containing protein n=1 Tax=Bradyrhizobium symbiodeficiens TaxID=1404367 RepID=A0ABX5W5A6_9BRAD|nr:helix-turn-helix domain-containing protein [Bradyrhizobium symbiodeficiens]QDF37428.1 helix-turn-helix transcriptional regulator [Bradyrhizobium symbiodeficiens]QIP00074.1 helix-turn-helix transcriptional regulator [Bradyrhizobium symbiodeficiens]